MRAAAPSGWPSTVPRGNGSGVPGEGYGVGMVALALLMVASLLTANPLLSAWSIAVFVALCALLWRRGEPPVLLFAAGFQWLQVTLKLWHANLLGVHIVSLSPSSMVETATWLGLSGVLVLALGMRLGLGFGLGRGLRGSSATGRSLVGALSTFGALKVYLAIAILGFGARALVWNVSAIRQPLMAFMDLRWVPFFIFGHLALSRRQGRWIFAAVALLEFVNGIGFFSEFRTVIFVTLLVLLTIPGRIPPRNVVALAGVFGLLVFLGIAWSAIKEDYRQFLNEGTRTQVVRVTFPERVATFVDMVGSLRAVELERGVDILVLRVAYVDYFAHVLEFVPQHRPHTDGALWGAAVLHPLTPRVLFPGKPPLRWDSDVTMEYTGLRLSSAADGTSISMGYMAESYIDFGKVGMWVPIVLIGLLWGAMYRFLVTRAPVPLIGHAFASALLIYAAQFEITGVKLLGGVLTKFIVFSLVLLFVVPWILRGLVQHRHADRTAPSAVRSTTLSQYPSGD